MSLAGLRLCPHHILRTYTDSTICAYVAAPAVAAPAVADLTPTAASEASVTWLPPLLLLVAHFCRSGQRAACADSASAVPGAAAPAVADLSPTAGIEASVAWLLPLLPLVPSFADLEQR